MENAALGIRNEAKATTVAGVRSVPSRSRAPNSAARIFLTTIVLGWFALLILVPTLALVRQALAGGLRPFVAALASADAQRAFGLTLGITAVATLVNTAFGLAFAVVLVRHKFWG